MKMVTTEIIVSNNSNSLSFVIRVFGDYPKSNKPFVHKNVKDWEFFLDNCVAEIYTNNRRITKYNFLSMIQRKEVVNLNSEYYIRPENDYYFE
ncbi:hypothetical protein EBU71_06305 [bacterium]|jgi:hypothetical protein|nr:hypothetical protein [Candidatus Elulimicrobium humile]